MRRNCKKRWLIQKWYQQKVNGAYEKISKIQYDTRWGEKKAQTEGDEKREERQRLNKEIRDLQAAKEAQLDSSGQATKAFGSKIYELQDKLKP